jgi:hypothetical protein
VAAEILAAVGSSGTPGGFGSGRAGIATSSAGAREPSAFPGSLNELPRPGRSRLGLVLGLGLSGALALFVSIKTCTSRHGQEVAVGPPALAPEGKKAEARPTAMTSPAPTIAAIPGRDAGAPTSEVGNAAVIATAGDAQTASEAGASPASAAGLADADSGGKRADNEIAAAAEGAAREPTAPSRTEPTHAEAGAVVPAGAAPPPTAPAVAVVSPTSREPAPPSVAAPSPSPSPPAEVAAEAPRPATGAAPSPATERPPSAVDPAGVAPAATPGAGSGTDTPSESSAEGQKVMVLIKSIPPGARVTTAHHDYGTTPLSIRLKAGNAYAFFLKYDGYRTTKQHLDVTAEPDQEVTVTLKKGSGAPAEVAASSPTTSAPSPSAPPTPPASPPGAKPADGSWWQKMFKKR